MSKAKFDSILGKMRKADSLTYSNGAMVIDVGSTGARLQSPNGATFIDVTDYIDSNNGGINIESDRVLIGQTAAIGRVEIASNNISLSADEQICLDTNEVFINGSLRGSHATFSGNLNANNAIIENATIENEIYAKYGGFWEGTVTDNFISQATCESYMSYNANDRILETQKLKTTDFICTDIIYNSALNEFIGYSGIRDVAYFCSSLSKLTLEQNLADLYGGKSFVIRHSHSKTTADRIYCDASQFLIHHYGQDIVKTERVYDNAYLNIDFAGILKKEYEVFDSSPESVIYLKDGTRTLIKATHSVNDVPVTYFGADGSAVISMFENGVTVNGYGSKPMLTQNADELLIASGSSSFFGSVKIGSSTTPNIDAIYLSATGIAQLKTLLGIN